MRLGQTLTTVEVEIEEEKEMEEEREIDEEGDIDAAEGVTNKQSESGNIDVRHFHHVLPIPHTMICNIATMKHLSFKNSGH